MTNNAKPVIGITMGDPAGVGPEITCKMFADKTVYGFCRPLVVGDSASLSLNLLMSLSLSSQNELLNVVCHLLDLGGDMRGLFLLKIALVQHGG